MCEFVSLLSTLLIFMGGMAYSVDETGELGEFIEKLSMALIIGTCVLAGAVEVRVWRLRHEDYHGEDAVSSPDTAYYEQNPLDESLDDDDDDDSGSKNGKKGKDKKGKKGNAAAAATAGAGAVILTAQAADRVLMVAEAGDSINSAMYDPPLLPRCSSSTWPITNLQRTVWLLRREIQESLSNVNDDLNNVISFSGL